MDLVKVIRRVQRKKAERERLKNQAFCRLCGTQTRFISFRQAMEVHQITPDEISRCVAKGLFHRVNDPSGEILFCQNSLRAVESQLLVTQPMRLEFLRGLGVA